MSKKKTSLFSILMYFVNTLFALLLLLSYLLPYISPKVFPIFGVLSLLVPILIIVNVVFVIYWLTNLKKHFLLSATVLFLGYFISTPFVKVSEKKNYLADDVSVMSYNVRLFNHYKQIKKEAVDDKILKLIKDKNPDVLAIQEFYSPYQSKINYPYHYFEAKGKQFGLAIFSKYKIINKGSLNFKNTHNNTIFVDILKGNDTMRVYNVHLQSLKINPFKENFGEENSTKLVKRLEHGFLRQTSQTDSIRNHYKNFKGNKIICGDFNNTAYSWAYKQLANGMKDTFIEAGKGFGNSFAYFFPMRIDFILVDSTAVVQQHKIFFENYSDHYPTYSRINFNTEKY